MEVFGAVETPGRGCVFRFFGRESVIDPGDGSGGEVGGWSGFLRWGHGAFCEGVMDAFQKRGLSQI